MANLPRCPLALVLAGEKASGNFLIEQARLVATNVQGQVVMGSGHWPMEEAPRTVIPALIACRNALSRGWRAPMNQ